MSMRIGFLVLCVVAGACARVPAAPQIEAVHVSNSSATVRWSRVPEADDYTVYWALEPGVTADNYDRLSGGARARHVHSPYTIPALTNDVPLFIVVTAVHGHVESAESSELEAVPFAPSWTNERTADPPPAYRGAAAYDSARERVVLLGGKDSGSDYHGETWEWDGARWELAAPDSQGPGRRIGGVLVYDPACVCTLSYGGRLGSIVFHDLWQWDGDAWNLVNGSGPARAFAAAAFDGSAGELVLFGGLPGNPTTPLGETWTWDGAVWSIAASDTDAHPTGVLGAAMAFDASRNRLVAFGGARSDGTLTGETWEWDGSTWTLVATKSDPGPSPRAGHRMSYHAGLERVVLFGGEDDANPSAELWTWDGTAWTQQIVSPPQAEPEPRSDAALAYDAARDQMVLFGGRRGAAALSDTWMWDGDWERGLGGTSLPPDSTIVYDRARQETVLVGAQQTWTWDGAWTQATTTVDPGPSTGVGVYDSVRDRVLLYDQHAGTTWEWDGGLWQLVAAAADGPPARRGAALAYDRDRNRTLLFGGSPMSQETDFLGDTWEWDGTTWRQLDTHIDAPTPRAFHAMAYDPIRKRTYLVGGAAANGTADMWEWDGSEWQRLDVEIAAGFGTNLVFDEARGTLVLFGGTGDDLIWEWDGVMWKPLTESSTNGPGELYLHGSRMTYDTDANRVVLYTQNLWEWGR